MAMINVYRWEKRGRGPYSEKLSFMNRHNDDAKGHPCPFFDTFSPKSKNFNHELSRTFISELFSINGKTNIHMLSGFISLAKMKQWFNKVEQAEMMAKGYVLNQ